MQVKIAQCALEDVTSALGYVYYLENCETALRNVKLSEHLQNHLQE
jgi:hypothetical protein